MTLTQATINHSHNNHLGEYSLVHSIEGRIRLRTPVLTKALQEQWEKRLMTMEEVKDYRFNVSASSMVINYQREISQDVFLNSLFLGYNSDNSGVSLSKIASDFTSINNRTFDNDSQNEECDRPSWSNLTLPLVSTGLAIVANRFPSSLITFLARSALISAGLPVATRAIESVFIHHKLNIDCLDLMALVLSGLQGKLLTPSLVITLHELGDLIREYTARSTEQKTANLLDTIGRFAWVEREGEIVQIKSDEVIAGEIVIVYPGERIPVDGIVTFGEATVDQQQLTGESMPIVAQIDTYVYASTLVRSGKIKVKSERIGTQTRAAASIELLERAPVHDTRMANYAAKVADKLIIPSMILAGIVFATTKDPTRTASILTLDFVTGIRVSMPTAFLGALNHTTRHGILVRSGRTMELLGEIDTIVFDKTGTLTEGNIKVVGVETVNDNITPQRLLQLAVSAEQRITHPVAEAIVNYGKQESIEVLPRNSWDYSVGSGMTAEIDGLMVMVGSEKFLRSQGVNFACIPENEDKSDVLEGLSFVYVACDGDLMGYLEYTDPLRPESASLLYDLQNLYGLEVHLLTGDNQTRAHQVAKVLNIPPQQVHADAFPEDKAKIVRKLSRGGKTAAFVGDGLNDSVALAYADVSISFADGSDIARETADVVLMNNNLSSILEAIAIAKETQSLIEQNTMLVIAPNLIGLGFASTIGLNPLLATIIHNGTAIAAGLNSLRPLVQHQLETKEN
ncbi:heavy metal translocating P-type ATPase [Cyanobacterium aponinum]|uniref:heavy metal translocating P-type ATPase n=1 Tax=Cyanobacterium aponinum TaxID=379064 RepID=UPI000C12B5F5|nr:heavy metal translocating P-type ATPase [Cyanobacterium aponinum]PHV61229.1 heavy metal translocating P-type ATPase [Cyanobacterium aponinum IPPAS B-1201]